MNHDTQPKKAEDRPTMGSSIIAVVNQKGGCGKTTSCINLASALAKKGFKVLIIDLDSQANCSLGLGVAVHNIAFSIYDVLVDNLDMQRAITPTYHPNLDIVPATSKLAGAQLEIADLVGREGILRTCLNRMFHAGIRHYHYILLDCSPSLNLITINGLVASRFVLIPIQAHYFSLEGMRELFSTVEIVKYRLNIELEILGILVTLFDGRTKMSQRMLAQIEEYFKGKVFGSKIRFNAKLIEATAHGKSIFDYDPRSNGAVDYRNLSDEVITLTRKLHIHPGLYA